MNLSQKLIALAACALVSGTMLAPPAGAQDQLASTPASPAPMTQRQLDWKAAKAERKAVFGENMLLNKKEEATFWPLYNQYEAAMDKIELRHVQEVREFSKNATSLTDAQATQKLDEVMAIAQDRLNVQKRFIPKFRAALGPIKTTRFFQIDNKLRALLQAQIAQMVPLATPPGALKAYGQD
ncbi:MAG TPA: hypothetical protein VKV28_12075 [Candidatus Binataceae bacterium]|nr:hypothetical protein [Candidatus Binataceae bacterium]